MDSRLFNLTIEGEEGKKKNKNLYHFYSHFGDREKRYFQVFVLLARARSSPKGKKEYEGPGTHARSIALLSIKSGLI